MLCRTLLIALLFACTMAASGDIYVSSNGADSNNGSTPASPLLTLAQAASLAASQGPNVRIFLETGSSFYAQTLDLGIADSTLVTCYGNTSLPRPRILQPRYSSPTYTTCISVQNANNTLIENIHLSGCSTGIEFRYSAPLVYQDITVTNMFFSDIKSPYSVYQPALPTWAVAVSFVTLGSGPAVRGVYIRNNVALRLDVFYQSSTDVQGLYLDSNTISKCNGNCISLGSGTNLHLSNSVFVRDDPVDLFLYGTTDVIVGTINGDNSVTNTDFNKRGEFQGGPDGCALDFETSAEGFTLTGCTFYRSWGAGIMVFGHGTTSQGLNISNNLFFQAGCTQARDDRGGIGFMCPNNNKPSGIVSYNKFWTCPNSEAMHQAFPGCDDNMTMVDNQINQGYFVDEPQINLNPPSPDSTDPNPRVPIQASCTTDGAVLRYTLDGSRPNETSPILPSEGVIFTLPGPNFAINVRGFKDGFAPSITNTMIVERATYRARNTQTMGLRSSLDALVLPSGDLHGWIVDSSLPGGGVDPVGFSVYVDRSLIFSGTANESRPDLVPPGVAPNADHGFSFTLPPSIVSLLQTGAHIVDVFALNSPSSMQPRRIDGSPITVMNGHVLTK